MVPNKKFEKDLYQRFDGPAKIAIRGHLMQMGHVVAPAKEDFGVDLKSFRKRKNSILFTKNTYLHEVEVSTGWKEHGPPPTWWDDPARIPYRKWRLLHNIKPSVTLTFWMINSIFSAAIYIDGRIMIDKPSEIRWVRREKGKKGMDNFFIFTREEFNYTPLQLEAK